MSQELPRRRHGFSLIELMVAMVISSVVIIGALGLLNAQQRTFRTGSSDRALQEAGRVALEAISADLRMAGFGMDPALVLDFGAQANVPMERAPTGTTGAVASDCATAVTCRDKTDGPDEIVFYGRNPAFGYPLVANYAGDDVLHLKGPLRTPLFKGQVLQVICFTGSMYWAYVRVAGYVAPSTDLSATSTETDVPVAIDPSTSRDFPTQNAILADDCFKRSTEGGTDPAKLAAAAKVYKIDRFHYFIRSYNPDGTVAGWGTAGATPYLMLEQGLKDTDDATALESVVAPDVEDLQLAYLFPGSPAALRLVGGASGTPIAASDQGIDLAPGAGAPLLSDAPDAASRATQHPGNIRAVRLGVVVRTQTFDSQLTSDGDRTLPATGNRAALLGPAGYRRLLFETTVALRNLDAQAPYFPVSSSDTTDQLNRGGG